MDWTAYRMDPERVVDGIFEAPSRREAARIACEKHGPGTTVVPFGNPQFDPETGQRLRPPTLAELTE